MELVNLVKLCPSVAKNYQESVGIFGTIDASAATCGQGASNGRHNVAGLKKTIIRGGLETLYFSGLHLMTRPLLGGVGAILTLHHVRPPRPDAFQPNRLLEVSPRFFEKLMRRLKRARIDVISLDEMHRRFISGDFKRRFVCITFDDGYKDIKEYAWPVLKKYELPFAL